MFWRHVGQHTGPCFRVGLETPHRNLGVGQCLNASKATLCYNIQFTTVHHAVPVCMHQLWCPQSSKRSNLPEVDAGQRFAGLVPSLQAAPEVPGQQLVAKTNS